MDIENMKTIEIVNLPNNKIVIYNNELKKSIIIRKNELKDFKIFYQMLNNGNELEISIQETLSQKVNFRLSSYVLEDIYLKLNYILSQYNLKILDKDLDFLTYSMTNKEGYTFKIVPINTSKVNKKYKFKANVNYYTSLKDNQKEANVEQVEDLSFYPFIITLNDKDNFISSPLLEMEDYEFDYHIRKGTSLGELLDFDYKKSEEIFEKVKNFMNNNYKFKTTQNIHKKWQTTISFKDEI